MTWWNNAKPADYVTAQPQLGIGIVTYGAQEQVTWWARQLSSWRRKHRFTAVVSSADDEVIETHGIPLVRGANYGVAHTKNRALRFLYGAGCDPIILIEDDCQLDWSVIGDLVKLAGAGVHHLMLGPVAESLTWEWTGNHDAIAGIHFGEYRRTRDPQDTPGVVTMVSRRAVDWVGGLDARFLGRGHAHGEWTARIENPFPNPLGSPYWHPFLHGALRMVDVPRKNPVDQEQIKLNLQLRTGLSHQRYPGQNLDFIDGHYTWPKPASVCIALKNRADSFITSLRSIAEWFSYCGEPNNEVVIADFGSTDCDPGRELRRHRLPGQVVKVDGFFSRAVGLHAAATAAENEILFFLDADVLVPPNMGEILRRVVRVGHCFFPICWSNDRSGTAGSWRHRGYGMLGITKRDYELTGGWNTNIKRWGAEDNDIHWHARARGLEIERFCVSGLVHQWHPDTTEFKEQHMDKSAPSLRSGWESPAARAEVRQPLRAEKIARIVSTVPARLAHGSDLARRIGAIQLMDNPPSGGSWANYQRALHWESPRGDWIVCLDDDAIVTDTFLTYLEEALRVCPGDFATFYLADKKLMARAARAGASWIATTRFVHGVCWAARPRLRHEIIETSEEALRADCQSGDAHLQAWLLASGRPNLISVPCLVDHNAELESVIKPGHHGSRAAMFVGESLAVPWTSKVYVDELDNPGRILEQLAGREVLRPSRIDWAVPPEPDQPRVPRPPPVPRVSFAISTVPERREALEDLIVALDCEPRVYCDDKLTGNGWLNYSRALRDANTEHDWIVSIDDDAELCPDFVLEVLRALTWCPGDLATFYLSARDGPNRTLLELARHRKARWIRTTRVVHGICFAVRTARANELADAADGVVTDKQCTADGHLQVGMLTLGMENWAAVPGLVGERRDMRSVCMPSRHNSDRRGALCFKRSDRDVRWTDEAVLDRTPIARPIRRFARYGILIPGYEELW